MTFEERVAASRRLYILVLLAASPGGSANEALLQAALDGYGHKPSLDQVAGDLAWLAEQGLVEASALHGLNMGRITARGEDVAAGRAKVPGVERPVRR